MIRVAHRTGRNTIVSGGLFAVFWYLLLVAPIVFMVQFGALLCWAFCWVTWQLGRAVVNLIRSLNRG